MADVTSRISYNNICRASATVITTPSVASGYASSWLKDPLRSKTWRSKSGWTIEAGFNDKLDFNESVSGDATATITAGTYTGDTLATEIQTRMNTAGSNTYTVTYSNSTYKFTIARSAGAEAINLEWATGDNAKYSIGVDIGFDTSADDSGSTSYTGDYAVYQSQHYINIAADSTSAAELGILHYHNIISTSASVELRADNGNTSTDWAYPALSTGLELGDVAIKWLTSSNEYQYWRFVIDNTRSSDGYTYVGVPYVGPYLQPSPGISNRFTEDYVELSEIGFSDHGALFQLERDRARSYSLVWVGLTSSQKDAVSTAAAYLRVGRPMFFSLNPQNDTDDAVYAFINSPISIQYVPPDHWQVTMNITEALG